MDPENEPGVWEGPSFDPHKYTVDELQEKMARAEFEYHFASKKLDEMQVQKTVREMKAKVIMASRSWHLLTNRKLADHLRRCFEVDPKFKITKELYEAFVYIEHQDLMEPWMYYEQMRDHAFKDHEMLGRHLSWYQSKLKQEKSELDSYGGGIRK